VSKQIGGQMFGEIRQQIGRQFNCNTRMKQFEVPENQISTEQLDKKFVQHDLINK